MSILRYIVLLVSLMLAQCKPDLSRSIFEVVPLLSLVFGQKGGLTVEVTGLEGKGLKIEASFFSSEKSDSSLVEISSNGSHKVPLEISVGSKYSVFVLEQPSNPTQMCQLAGNVGIMTSSGATVSLQCKTALPSVATPYFTPPPGEYPSAVNVSITSTSSGSQIFYTTDGSDPSCNGTGLAYTSPIFIPQPSLTPVTLKAIACANGEASFVQLGSYRVTNGILSPPTSSLTTNPPAPNYTSAQTTTLSPPPSPSGVTVHYTTDGSTPTCSSPSSPNPVSMPNSMTIRAIACHPDWTSSVVVDFPYIITGTVDTPSFSVSGGTYTNAQNVGLSVITSGASIRYELAVGSAPATPNCSTSTLYTGPIHVNQTDTRIQAIGCLSGWTDSPVSSVQTYTLNVANPVLNPFPPTDVSTSQTVTASSSTSSATYHYTTDGTPPTCASSSSPPNIVGDGTEVVVTVKVIACRSGFNPSSVVSGNYTKTGTLAPPTFSPVAGTYTSAQNVTINPPGSPSGVQIHYRTDGAPADCSDTLYTGPINVSSSQTITAISCKSSPAWDPSTVATASYTITATVATPTFSPPAAIYNDVQSVNITSSTMGAAVYYNWAQGSDPPNPTCGSGSTSLPFSVTKTDTRIKAIACLSGWADSAIASAVYTLRPDTPVPNLAPATYGNAITINFTSSTGASIQIKEGPLASPPADPTCADPVGSSINIPDYSGTRVVKAIACRTDFTPSLVFSGNYTVNGKVTAPTLSSLNQNNEITITANSPPAIATQTLCYTTTGTDPQCSTTNGGSPDINGGFCASGSTPYTAPVQFATTTDFRVRACATNHNQSNVVQQTVTISGTVGAVTSSHPTGTYYNDLTSVVTLSATSSTHIYYRTDGTNPDCSGVGSTLYSTAFTVTPISGSRTVKAIGCAAGKTPSSIASFNYTFVVATPTFSEPSGTKNNDISVALSTTTTGATLKYQFGTDPTCGSSTYSSPINLPSAAASPTVNLRVIGCKLNYFDSSTALNNYIFETAIPVVKNHMTNAIIATDISLPPSTIRWESTTSNARFCLHVVNDPSFPNPTCNGTTGNCGTGMIDLGLNSSPPQIYNYSGANTVRMAVRVCKQYYNAHTALTTRKFSPIIGKLRMFVSQNSYQGNLSGVLGADEKCNSDSNRPVTISPYLAFVGHTTDRSASAVYIPNFTYIRPDLTIGIFTADSSGMPPATLVNSVSTSSTDVWTGFGIGFTVGGNCSNWGSNSLTGARGNSGATNSDWYTNVSLLNCSSSYKLYCVESRYRMWVTNNTYNGALGGLSGADAKCNEITDANHPKSGKYKAFIVLGSRVPNGTDWVFKPGVAYYRTDRITLIGVTTHERKLPATLANPITPTVLDYWTGGNFAWNEFSSNNCSGFTSASASGNGAYGKGSDTTNYHYYGTFSCNTNQRLLCVEQ